MIYYIADTHFGHHAIIKFQNRPFEDVNTMNACMIENWNTRVKNNDTVYIIGDMFFKCEDPETILKQLKGKKILIQGNHDESWLKDENLHKYFEKITGYEEIYNLNKLIVMCHYPLLTWKKENKSYMVYGHIHASTNMDFWPLIKSRDRMLNADVEINNYTPVTLTELIINNENFKRMN